MLSLIRWWSGRGNSVATIVCLFDLYPCFQWEHLLKTIRNTFSFKNVFIFVLNKQVAWNNNGRHSIRGRFHQTLCAFAIKIPFNFIIKIQSNVHVLVCDRFCFPFTRSAWCLPGIWQSSKKQKQICWWNWPNDKVEVAYPNIDLCYYCPSNVNCNTFFWPSVLSISFEAITTFVELS